VQASGSGSDSRIRASSVRSRPGRFLTVCRRYTSVLLVVVGIVVGLTLLLLDVWWGLVVAVVLAFAFGAVLARPWCGAAGQ
jgi:hypothetical protein